MSIESLEPIEHESSTSVLRSEAEKAAARSQEIIDMARMYAKMNRQNIVVVRSERATNYVLDSDMSTLPRQVVRMVKSYRERDKQIPLEEAQVYALKRGQSHGSPWSSKRTPEGLPKGPGRHAARRAAR